MQGYHYIFAKEGMDRRFGNCTECLGLSSESWFSRRMDYSLLQLGKLKDNFIGDGTNVKK